jgi:SAM-dependent methyltransferase
MNRFQVLRKLCRIGDGRGLEFGPLASPVISKSEGTVYYVDHTTTENLRKHWVVDPNVNVSNLVNVDFVLERGPLREIAANEAPFDYAIASHVFEHLPDPIGWLTELHSLLSPGGVIALAIPDKRFTFDIGRRLTTAGDLLAYHYQKLTRPSPVQVLDHFLNVRRVDVTRAWETELNPDDLPRMSPDDQALELCRRSALGEYIDTHCTVWTAGHFLAVAERVKELGFLPFEVADFQWPERNSLEFLVTMRKAA